MSFVNIIGGGKDLATAASISTLKEEPKEGKVKTEGTSGNYFLLLDYRTRGYFVFFILLFMSRGKYKVP
jgi:hypothetical protein